MTSDQSLRVLIVDDNRDDADALGLLLEELDNQVHVTYGGIQALDVATAFRPDLMLVDLIMPRMDGCTLVSRFRQLPGFANTKILEVSLFHFNKILWAKIIGVSNKTPKNQLTIFFINIKRRH